MDRKRSKYSSEKAAICMAAARKIARNRSHQCSLLSLSFCLCLPFSATMDFSDRELSSDLSCLGESSVEFVAECGDTRPGLGRQPIVYCLE